jgi:hypothetical protein
VKAWASAWTRAEKVRRRSWKVSPQIPAARQAFPNAPA